MESAILKYTSRIVMESKGNKILMFDEATGMLSKEVMMAYIYGELSPSLREDVEKFLANNEMHRDIIEGLRQLSNKSLMEKAIHSINERIYNRTGAVASGEGFSLETNKFLGDYKKIA